jgi:PTH1 family peptidyl-tRNA hydrolase
VKLIVGLGNPGAQYDRTPHNIGFDCVDELARRYGASWVLERRFEAMTATLGYPFAGVTLMKPMTYMNLSGRSVAAFARKNGLEPEQVLVISDDLHLDLGRLRLRADGSHGGQKGLLSIMQLMATQAVPRLRIGVRPADHPTIRDFSAFVLGKFSSKNQEAASLAVQDAADCVEVILKDGLETAMNRYNRATRQ